MEQGKSPKKEKNFKFLVIVGSEICVPYPLLVSENCVPYLLLVSENCVPYLLLVSEICVPILFFYLKTEYPLHHRISQLHCPTVQNLPNFYLNCWIRRFRFFFFLYYFILLMDNYGYKPDSEDEEEESGAKGNSVSDDEPFILPDVVKNKINPYWY